MGEKKHQYEKLGNILSGQEPRLMCSFSLQLSVHMVIPAHLGLEAGEPSAQGRAD